VPAVGTLCADPAAADLILTYGQAAVAETLRLLLAEVREALTGEGQETPDPAALLAEAGCRLGARRQETLKRVINATGVVIHTNLGRAPLAPEAVLAMAEAAGYGNLEFDLETGRRASRHDHLMGLIGEVTGAEGGLVVNNCAGAVLLALSALAGGGPVIVSRGELVEIGGGFRVPDIVRQSGARLVEVGTTNRTHLSDYEQALSEHPDARIILRTHPSNFRIIGFTSAPSIADLAAFAHARGVLLVEDLGGGALVDLEPFGITGEPPVQDSVRDGADLVIFSGDKLLGGPQAGILAGRSELLERLAHHPLARALRLDKLSLAALAATLRLYLPPNDPTRRVPVLRMLTQTSAVVQARAEALKAMIADHCGLTCSVLATSGYAGGGAMPMQALNSWGLCLDHPAGSAEDLARRLRTGPVPVIGRIERGQVILDLRTVADEALADLAQAIRHAALAPPLGGSDLPA
jgi:L-seryl-tRNA(Ser) seleniumtransferase